MCLCVCVCVCVQLVVRVFLEDGSSKTLMVDERQTVRDVLDDLFEKTHCDHSLDWSLCENNPDLQAGETHTRGDTHARQHTWRHTHVDECQPLFLSRSRAGLRGP